jgi:hypothetical protein
MLMDSADWADWADVFRAGGREVMRQFDPGTPDVVSYPLARTLNVMADQCDQHAADARAVGR